MRYRVHRIKDQPGEYFRWAAHTGGLAIVKTKDYEPGYEVEAGSPYAAWKRLAEEGTPLRTGDLLEALEPDAGPTLQILKYIGFEGAQWFIPEPKADHVRAAAVAECQDTSNERAISGNRA